MPFVNSSGRASVLDLEWIAERRIREAIERGDFDRLPGAGKPLALDDEPLVPEDLRVAYRILKNAGYAPPEVRALRQVAELERWIAAATDAESKRKALARLALLRASLESHRGPRTSLDDPRYADRLLGRFDRGAPSNASNGHDDDC